jgi:TatD DNase family protein
MPVLVDSHCHLDLEQFAADRDEVLERARAAGVRAIVNPGIDVEGCRAMLELADATPDLYAAVGVHPNSTAEFSLADVAALRALADHPKVVAIGEIGLDYYWKKVDVPSQQDAFEQQLGLAAELGLPVIIHCRDANDDVAAVLRNWVGGRAFRTSPLAQRRFVGVLHAFPGDLALAEEAYGWGFVIGLGGPVTFRNARSLHALAARLRLERMVIETDAPYLTPHPHRGERNEPAYVALVAQQLAHLSGRTVDEVALATTAVAAELFELEDLLRDTTPSADGATDATRRG